MKCPKCQGFLYTLQVPADTIVLHLEACLNCGLRREPGFTPVSIEAQVRIYTACINCGKPPAPGYSQCDRCREKQRARRQVRPRHKELARRELAS